MREILFRGKRIEDGDWVYGWAYGDKAKSIIEIDKEYPNEYGVEAYYTSPVIPKTVGQYTGLKDRNGKRIFEGDVVICRAGETYLGRSEHEATVTVEFGFTQAMWEMLQYDTLEIIGNIHEEVQE